jgi:CheY-like chemotaxis protein
VSRRSHRDLRFSNNILIVDDSLINRLAAASMLKKLGYTSGKAENGRLAIKALVDGRYDLVLMDCQMPVMDGYDATMTIRELPPPYCRIPIIAVSSDVTAENRKKCEEAGMNDFLPKPYLIEELDEIISLWIPAWDRKGAV